MHERRPLRRSRGIDLASALAQPKVAVDIGERARSRELRLELVDRRLGRSICLRHVARRGCDQSRSIRSLGFDVWVSGRRDRRNRAMASGISEGT